MKRHWKTDFLIKSAFPKKSAESFVPPLHKVRSLVSCETSPRPAFRKQLKHIFSYMKIRQRIRSERKSRTTLFSEIILTHHPDWTTKYAVTLTELTVQHYPKRVTNLNEPQMWVIHCPVWATGLTEPLSAWVRYYPEWTANLSDRPPWEKRHSECS